MNRILVSGASAAFAKLRAAAESEEYEFVLAEGEPRAAECAGYDAVLFVLPAFTQGRAERKAAHVPEAAAGVAVFVRAEERAAAEETLGGLGVLVASAGANAKNIPVLLSVAVKITRRLRLLGSENVRLRGTIDDLKLIDRAKCALIQYLNMTEADAHRFIEKQAMNRRQPKREVALEILKTYES